MSNPSTLTSGGKEINRDRSSNGERSGKSLNPKFLGPQPEDPVPEKVNLSHPEQHATEGDNFARSIASYAPFH